MTHVPEKFSLDEAVFAVEAWMAKEGFDLGLQWKCELTLQRNSPWLLIDVRPSVPFVRGEVPDCLSFGVWLTTGALHRVVNGEVQDPEIGLVGLNKEANTSAD